MQLQELNSLHKHFIMHWYRFIMNNYKVKFWKKKDLILSITGKVAYISHGVTIHSTLHFPLSPCHMVPLACNKLDILSKGYKQFNFLLIYEVSLIGSQFIFNIEKLLGLYNTSDSPITIVIVSLIVIIVPHRIPLLLFLCLYIIIVRSSWLYCDPLDSYI